MTGYQRAILFFRRAMRLRCPECGVSPLFVPIKRVRNSYDLLTPLDGCARCGYAYEREEGYWLIATWVINYALVAGLGLATALVVDSVWHPPLWKTCLLVFTPMPFLSLAVARHAKALFLAVDHYCDPHVPHPPTET